MDNSENLPVQRILRINIHLDSKFLFVPINYLKGGLDVFFLSHPPKHTIAIIIKIILII
jgi:hypothetical protein